MKNLQGDIIALVDEDCNTVVRYRYDAWGKCTITCDNSGVGIATVNPYRYRGYYYDTETGLYYLQSRYYDPETGRFINADEAGLIQISVTVVELNLFVYCDNNPIPARDISGKLAIKIVSAIVGGLVSALIYLAVDAFLYFVTNGFSLNGYKVNGWRVAWEFGWGCISGLFIPTGLDRKQTAIISSAINTIKGIIYNIVNTNDNFIEILGKAVMDFIAGYIAGWVGGPGCKSQLRGKITFKDATPVIKCGKEVFEATPYNISVVVAQMWNYIKSVLLSNINDKIQNFIE